MLNEGNLEQIDPERQSQIGSMLFQNVDPDTESNSQSCWLTWRLCFTIFNFDLYIRGGVSNILAPQCLGGGS